MATGLSVKGTGFSPYILSTKVGGALAPEANPSSICPDTINGLALGLPAPSR